MRLVMPWRPSTARSLSEFYFSVFNLDFMRQVRVLGIGLTLFLFLPAAFVDVDTSQLEVDH